MSVLIKGMEMPEKCGKCRFATAFECQVTKNFITTFNVRQVDCPLVSVPPHGRLIEESKVLDIVSEWCPDDDGSVGKYGDLREMLDEIEAIPTVIPASKEAEE